MKNIITIVVEVDDDLNFQDHDEDIWIERVAEGLADVFDSVEVTDVHEGNRTNVKPEHFSDRELAERGLPPFAYADDGMGNCIKLERGMMGYFPRPPYSVDSVSELNGMIGVTPEQAEAMSIGSMVGWHVPGAFPKAHVGFSSHPVDVLQHLAGAGHDPAEFAELRKFSDEIVTVTGVEQPKEST